MLAFCPLLTPDACVRISSCTSQPHSPHHPLPTATAGDWSERCRKMLAKRNTGARLDSCLEAVGASVDAAVEQFERRLDVSGGGRWRQGGARREEGGGGVSGDMWKGIGSRCAPLAWRVGRKANRCLLSSKTRPAEPLVLPPPAAAPLMQAEKRLVVSGGQPGATASEDGQELYCLCQRPFLGDATVNSECTASTIARVLPVYCL